MFDYKNDNSVISKDAKIYKYSRVKESAVHDKSSVGDNSRVDFSTLHKNVRIDRNNHIFQSLISRYTYTGMNTVIMHASIGSFTSISWNVSIGGANHDYNRTTQHSFLYNDIDNIRASSESAPYDRFEAPVSVGNDVWIAAGAVVTRGVVIGDGAVVGANAVVTKDVPPYSIVAGSPAKIIKYRFSAEIIELLLKIKWWEWPIEKIKANYSLLAEQPSAKGLKEILRVSND
ncbi:Putative acetyltransferase [Pseudoalteromonas carrageenovora]|uniref:Streptogramin A acetyltransferase n=2 Tax=Pseudoalteromonas carrageenovora IAM 12662 TaxID=1314868 RepID=A0A2K4X5W4_PSEVC|nr:CatB-related O-acetyltransferase [Pseudoalteromonas carrageenovora]QBJ70665.1 Putative acetyltransferase [Pseudoalteromonas carrageenovora]GEB69779.1 acetyltransferase [Pseudoalteromonas carrageenovora]SOU39728.1 Streptogramin A acetyltransferase [Pseudoalteromonas carrageenovora IAM 12662]